MKIFVVYHMTARKSKHTSCQKRTKNIFNTIGIYTKKQDKSITLPYVTKDQIAAAREMDLLTYLRRFDPEELVHIGGNTGLHHGTAWRR